MADFGFTLTNDNGELQVDSAFKNLGVKTTGVFSGTGINAIQEFSAVFTAGDFPMIALAIPTGVAAGAARLDSSKAKYRVGIHAPTNASYSVPYAILDTTPGMNAPGSHGIIVNNAAGERVFDSRERILSVFHVEGVPGMHSYEQSTPLVYTFTHPSRPNPYVLMTSFNIGFYGGSDGFTYDGYGYASLVKRIDGTTLREAFFLINNYTVNDFPYGRYEVWPSHNILIGEIT